MKKGIAILGSTGSIGRQAIQVLKGISHLYIIKLISGHKNAQLIIQQALSLQPKYVVVTDKIAYEEVSKTLSGSKSKILFGEAQLLASLEDPEIDVVLNAIVGFAGLKPLLHSISHKKQILLANKESLVVAGEIVMSLAKENDVKIIPIDSEHSALFQCLQGEEKATVEKVILTASGGPFLDYSIDEFRSISPEAALKHPIWKMGEKVSVDSATLMNKGLELIEARWLFDLEPHQIDLIIHPQSIIHSLVQFTDGSLKAQLSAPDMQLPIQYALHYPKRSQHSFSPFSLTDTSQLTFQQADRKKFRNLALAFIAMEKRGNMAAILNAANEVAVRAFLDNKWPFYRIPELIEEMMNSQVFISKPSLETYFETTKKCFADSLAYISKHK